GDAAGHEAVVPAEVDVAVEGEAVHRHASADPDTDGADLALGAAAVAVLAQPDAAAAGDPGGLDAEVAAGEDQCLLDATHVVDDADVLGEPNDRVADELAGSVEGDLAAAVDVDDVGTTGVDRALVRVGALAAGEGRRVLEQQDPAGGTVDDLGVMPALHLPGLEVLDRAQLVVLHDHHGSPLRRGSGQVLSCAQPVVGPVGPAH